MDKSQVPLEATGRFDCMQTIILRSRYVNYYTSAQVDELQFFFEATCFRNTLCTGVADLVDESLPWSMLFSIPLDLIFLELLLCHISDTFWVLQ